MRAAMVKGANRPDGADHVFQEWFWRFQRLAWLGLVLFIAAALAGLTGRGGPLAREVAGAGDAQIDYAPVARWQTAETLTVRLPADAPRAEVLLPESFLGVFEIESVTPQPERVTATAAGARFAFAAEPAAASTLVHFAIRARDPAMPAAAHRLEVAGIPVTLRVAVLP